MKSSRHSDLKRWRPNSSSSAMPPPGALATLRDTGRDFSNGATAVDLA